MDVIKKSGRKEPFDGEKIKRSVLKAYVDAGESVEKSMGAIDKVSREASIWAKKKGNGINTGEIKEKILELLDETKAGASEAWRDFDAKYKAG